MEESTVSSTTHDFVTETKGQCFLCSKNTSFQYSSSRPESSPTYSLHCLARYLTLDMGLGKVFTGNEPIPTHLVERVKRSRLKAELCGECVVLNKRFSKIFRQLEKVEMEANSCLDLIYEKLRRAVKFEEAKSWDGDSKNEWGAKLEIAEALKKDARQKCSRKLGIVLPQTKIERLTWKQINAEKGKIRSSNESAVDPQWNPYFVSDYEHYDDIGSPASFPALDDESYLDESHTSFVEAVTEEWTAETSLSWTTFKNINIKVEAEVSEQNRMASKTVGPRSRGQANHNSFEKDRLSQAIPPPLAISKGVGIDEKPGNIKNSDSGKYKCPICSREYVHGKGFQAHYKSAHLKMRYTCGTCKKEFPQKHVYERHYLNIHMGVRFKCGKCNKTFTQEGHLKEHQNKFH